MEITRREALMGTLLPFVQAVSGTAQSQPVQRAQNTVFEHDLPNLAMDGWQVNASIITLPPGSAGAPHHHPGFVLVYVLEGEVVTKISDQQQATYSTGQMFYEQPGATHEVSRNASTTKPAKFLAMIFAKKGLPLVTPA
jgi:quercetin dioxygenase-like cupin family protein